MRELSQLPGASNEHRSNCPVNGYLMSIEIKNISKRFGNFQALHDVSLAIDSGELLALLGPSGCGKTTLLRIIAGLESADEGIVLFSGEDATDLHARDRQVGFVFQHYALFRHMTIFENVAFGLRVKRKADRPSESQIKKKVTDLLHLVNSIGLLTVIRGSYRVANVSESPWRAHLL